MPSLTIEDYRIRARRRLPHFLFEYIDGGSGSESTLRANRVALDHRLLRQRVLRNVSAVSTRTSILGRDHALPLILAPVGLAGMNARRGECQAARAAEAAQLPFCLSTVSVCTLEEVRAATGASFWFQLYMIRDRALMRALLMRARAAGCETLVFTVDMPVPGTRYRDYRSGLAGAPGLRGALRRAAQAAARPRWAFDVGLRGRPHGLGNVVPALNGRTGLEDFFAWMRGNFDATVTWDDLREVRDLWPGKLVVKGLLDADDATSAIAVGADALVVSNHGGRQLDGALGTADALPAIVEAVKGRASVFVDGGVRSGADIVKMMALGADAVMIGRPWAYALAAGGERGVTDLVAMLRRDMEVTMALTGAVDVAAITPELLLPVSASWSQ